MFNKNVPFCISLIGVISDYITTRIGLSMGYYETHPQYHPILALIIFWSAIYLLTISLPDEKRWNLSVTALACVSFLGAVNNSLVILGLFTGLVI